jgi:O-antigen/teichoic acid export membrane protein
MLIFTYISISIASYSAPLLADRFIRGDQAGLRSLYVNSIVAGAIMLFPIFIVLAGFPGLVLDITFGSAYVEHAHLMTILSIGFFINALTGPTVTMMNMTDNQSKLLIFSISNVVIGLVLTCVLTYFFSLTGAAIASSIVTALFRLALFFYITLRILKPRPTQTAPLRS